VRTTELGYMAKLKPEFEQRNVKIIGLSVNPFDWHSRCADDIKDTQGLAPSYLMIGETHLSNRHEIYD
jgi:thioredoxin-dependent peroxiredoxin